MVATAPRIFEVVRPLLSEVVPRRRVDPDADLRPLLETSANVAPVRTHTPPRVIAGCRVSITGGMAFVEVDGELVAFAVDSTVTHRDAAAEARGMTSDPTAGWVAGKIYEIEANPGFGTAVRS